MKNLGSLLMESKKWQSPKMYKDVKQILDNLKYCKEHDEEDNYYPEDIFLKDEPYILLDYITKLEQENTRLRQQNFNLIDFRDSLIDENTEQQEQLYDYKSRIGKAINLIRHNDIYDYRVFEEMLLDILQGDNNE